MDLDAIWNFEKNSLYLNRGTERIVSVEYLFERPVIASIFG